MGVGPGTGPSPNSFRNQFRFSQWRLTLKRQQILNSAGAHCADIGRTHPTCTQYVGPTQNTDWHVEKWRDCTLWGVGRGLYPMQGASRQSYVSELLGPINYRLQTWHETSTLCELSVSRTLASLSQLAHLEPWLCTWSKMNRVRTEHARPTAPSPGAYVPIKNIKLRSLVRTRRI